MITDKKPKGPYYRQCHLVKLIETGTIEQTSWIPDKFAKIGGILKLRDEHGEWTDGWKVTTASSEKLPHSAILDWRKAIKEHLKRTGDSLPKETPDLL